MKKKNNIVILCGQYYPNAGAPVNCFLPYIKELKKENAVTIVCRKTSGISVLNYDDTEPFIQLTTWYNSLRYFLVDRIKERKHIKLYTYLLNIVRFISFIRTMFCYPTQHNWIIKKYLRTLNAIEKRIGQIDVIISVSFPFCSHIAALNFKKDHPQVKWLTYSTDPFTFNECQYERVPFKSFKRRWARKKEKEIYDKADANIVTEELYSMLVESFKQRKEKTIPFPYLILPSLHGMSRHFSTNQKIINCVYAGSLYTDIRNPRIMIKLFEKIRQNIKLKLFADGDLTIRGLLKEIHCENIEVNGLVNRKEYERIIKEEADILINIGNTTLLQSPSKLLELVSTGKPIINFYSNEDFGYQVIKVYPLGLNISNKVLEDDSVTIVENFCFKNMGVILPFELIKNLYPNHIMENHMKILNSLVSQH